eukprot:7386038-Prymnesium_polylepis.2
MGPRRARRAVSARARASRVITARQAARATLPGSAVRSTEIDALGHMLGTTRHSRFLLMVFLPLSRSGGAVQP